MNSLLKVEELTCSLVTLFNKNKSVFLAILCVLTAYIFYISLLLALGSSQDMPWYPATLLWDGVNPYTEYLSRKDDWFMTQAPVYSHLIYFLIYPLTLLDWHLVKVIWATGSMLAFLATLYIFFKEGVYFPFLFLVAVLSVAGYPLSNVIGNAQVTCYIVFATAVAWSYRKKSFLMTSAALTFVFFKYSFGLPILFGFFLAGYYREVITALFINSLAVIAFAIWFDLSVLDAALLPLKVALEATQFGPIDLLSLGRMLQENELFKFNIAYVLVPVIFALFFITVVVFRKKISEGEIISLSLYLSLVTFFHLGYDHLMLMVALLIMRDTVKGFNVYFLSFFAISVFLWFGPVLKLLGLNLTFSMKMSIEYTLTLSVTMLTLVALFLKSVILVPDNVVQAHANVKAIKS